MFINNVYNVIFKYFICHLIICSLECELCISPRDLINKNVWYYSWQKSSNNLSVIQENDYFQISSLDLSLTIINMDETKTGFYQCKLSNSESGPYFVELIKDGQLEEVKVNFNLILIQTKSIYNK